MQAILNRITIDKFIFKSFFAFFQNFYEELRLKLKITSISFSQDYKICKAFFKSFELINCTPMLFNSSNFYSISKP